MQIKHFAYDKFQHKANLNTWKNVLKPPIAKICKISVTTSHYHLLHPYFRYLCFLALKCITGISHVRVNSKSFFSPGLTVVNKHTAVPSSVPLVVAALFSVWYNNQDKQTIYTETMGWILKQVLVYKTGVKI